MAQHQREDQDLGEMRNGGHAEDDVGQQMHHLGQQMHEEPEDMGDQPEEVQYDDEGVEEEQSPAQEDMPVDDHHQYGE